jgi:CubicO group peptidase (beta-lactamase class C family)
VDGDTVCRIASCSKLFTAYMLFLDVRDQVWVDALLKYLPELRGDSAWEDVTVNAVASHLAGI